MSRLSQTKEQLEKSKLSEKPGSKMTAGDAVDGGSSIKAESPEA